MSYAVTIIADSIAMGCRITTFELTMPRFILAELNTHRDLSRNSASSRAIPVEKRVASVRLDPFVPEAFHANKRGMQAGEILDEEAQEEAQECWLRAALRAAESAEELSAIQVHKQWANRPIEPYAWHTVVLTSTEWANFFALRLSAAAQPEIRRVATLMVEAYALSTPKELRPGEWHLPYVTPEEIALAYPPDALVDRAHYLDLARASIGRCAAVSFERQRVANRDADVERTKKLRNDAHMSPFEHVAQVARDPGKPPFSPRWVAATNLDAELHPAKVYGIDNVPIELEGELGGWKLHGFFCGNFRAPWIQFRKYLPGEAVYTGR